MTHLTLDEAADSLHEALRDYIEATYHISDQKLVDQRRSLLDDAGVIRQDPYIESTPRYRPGASFAELGLSAEAADVLHSAAAARHDGRPLIYDPPFEHQAAALRTVIAEGRSAIVTTGTGSGKTEAFLLPILARLAEQASRGSAVFGSSALRALVLYPMNALVNDQLGRMRILFGNKAVTDWFNSTGGRPIRFARYTSRTLYPGVRTAKRDQQRLRPLGKYYVRTATEAVDPSSPRYEKSRTLLRELQRRGKWPAKPDLVGWYGSDGSRWQNRTGEFVRCVARAGDPELLTRHEVLGDPPDILITNYSMLEYMLMRPLERSIFDRTEAWYATHTDETLIVVVDEAHLYRGASGSEVALLLRRLRDRLGLPADRLQVICTTASFGEAGAADFAAELTGKEPRDFSSIKGEMATHPDAHPGTNAEAEIFASVDLSAFYGGQPADKLIAVQSVLEHRGVASTDVASGLHEALSAYPAMKLLVNATMTQARRVSELGSLVFPDAEPSTAARAATSLVALGSYAREPGKTEGPGLIPSRVHAFFRGLPGLWACVDPQCTELEEDARGGPAGRLYAQPIDRCKCGARVFELYTCRECGSAYSRAYADSVDTPTFLWSSPGSALASATNVLHELEPIDLLLQEPVAGDSVRPADLDIVTGRIDPRDLGMRNRVVYLPPMDPDGGPSAGQFMPCGVCGKSATFGRSSVQDHLTKGDEPFQALITRQVEIQAQTEVPTKFAPMGGRKVLVFSDSRQTAARLAPNLQRYTTRDAVRPLLISGYRRLSADRAISPLLSLEDSYFAILLEMERFGVRLRPATRMGDTFDMDVATVRDFAARSEPEEEKMPLLVDFRSASPPVTVVDAIHDVINQPYLGIAPLALATIEPKRLPDPVSLPAIGAISSDTDKAALVSLWLNQWRGQRLSYAPDAWLDDNLRPQSGNFQTLIKRLTSTASEKRSFERDWLPVLRAQYAEPVGGGYRLRAVTLTLRIGGVWGYCTTCRATQRPLPWYPTLCARCGRNTLAEVDPDGDQVFSARKGYYRRSTVLALREDKSPIALVAAEHTAQLNEAQAEAVFSEAEENELLFQDVDLGEGKPAIDVLSCTTTMEVGIDIGSLAGVALRNMPPSRANYQQRAGRSGRRGRAIATVIAFAGAQSHDEYGFSSPDDLIRGQVIDPETPLDNWQIARRHLAAFVVQEYLRSRVPDPMTANASAGVQLFEVLGSVDDFLSTTADVNWIDFQAWVSESMGRLVERARSWLPHQLEGVRDRLTLEAVISETAAAIGAAVGADAGIGLNPDLGGEQLEPAPEAEPELGDPSGRGTLPPETLLGRLLYRGVLPRYAFPTDVATFHVFDPAADNRFRPTFLYTPGQGMAAALSQYAPGKRVWIGGREWISGAVYTRIKGDRSDAWARRRVYRECGVCHYAETRELEAELKDHLCPACGAVAEFGGGQTWFRPPGFAHPVYLTENTAPDDEPPPSRATRAKLRAPTPLDPTAWTEVNDRVGLHFDRMHLLVTNRGPRDEGYDYCTLCGVIEPSITPHSVLRGAHRKPYLDQREPECQGNRTARRVVLGTDFLTDVLLVSLSVDAPLTLRPDYDSTRVALRTVSEALVTHATRSLGIGEGELQAEFRPSITAEGRAGTKAEVYMYDTLPGGAGFAQRVAKLGSSLLDGALDVLENCASNCSSSCYRCLRSYKNQYEHGLLDRHLGSSLIRYLLTADLPVVDAARVEESTDLLFTDLQGHGLADLKLARDEPVDVVGFGSLPAPILATRANGVSLVVVLRHPFAPSVALQAAWTQPSEFSVSPLVLTVDELAVRRNLPRASAEVLKRLGYAV